MTSAELAIIAALGASALTGLASLGVVWFQEWRRKKASDQAELQTAVTELLTQSMAVAMKARAVGETAPLLFTAIGSQLFSTSLGQPINAIPIVIYQDGTTKCWRKPKLTAWEMPRRDSMGARCGTAAFEPHARGHTTGFASRKSHPGWHRHSDAVASPG